MFGSAERTELLSKIETALHDNSANYNVAYLTFDDLPTGTNDDTELYCHTEDIAKDEKNDEGEVVSTILATVQDMTTKETIYDVANESGKILNKDDIVRLYETNGNFCNQYIGLKC